MEVEVCPEPEEVGYLGFLLGFFGMVFELFTYSGFPTSIFTLPNISPFCSIT